MPTYSVVTDHPVAVDSWDHLSPGGTMHDNSRWHAFNEKLYGLFEHHPISVLDLGCAGGGFVKDCIDDGHNAVGIEGSDYSLVRKRAEWATIPLNLFTADILKPFTVLEDGEPARFDCVTAWEVLEHLNEEGMPTLCDNIKRHLVPGGYFIGSVSTQIGEHHSLVKPKAWWLRMFTEQGFTHHDDLIDYFGEDWIRGIKQNAPQSFHVVLTLKGDK